MIILAGSLMRTPVQIGKLFSSKRNIPLTSDVVSLQKLYLWLRVIGKQLKNTKTLNSSSSKELVKSRLIVQEYTMRFVRKRTLKC